MTTPTTPILDSKCPSGPMSERWSKHRFELKLVNPANKRKFHVLVVGTGLAEKLVDAFLGASFEGGRHAGRVQKIEI